MSWIRRGEQPRKKTKEKLRLTCGPAATRPTRHASPVAGMIKREMCHRDAPLPLLRMLLHHRGAEMETAVATSGLLHTKERILEGPVVMAEEEGAIIAETKIYDFT